MPSAVQATKNQHARHLAWHVTRYRMIQAKEIRISAGAGFIVVLLGDVMTMPGLPKKPAALNIDIDDNGNVVGLF